ncbi:MAG TPA: hypothetical protein VGW38_25075, partial [Chloroflexota bacterium]|nr:hypothetical protein [Chloroflexota bacterium]
MLASRLAILALLYLALAAPLAGQTIQGRVLDAASGEAVAQASVTVLGSNQRPVGRTRAGADGSF